MRVFVTGATGFIGTRVTKELLSAGHEVLGLTRSDAGAAGLQAAGAAVHYGSLEDLDSLRAGAAASDAVIHLAFNHDFSKWAEHCEADRGIIEALGAGLAGSSGTLIVTSGTAIAHTPGRLTTEEDAPNSPLPRVATEQAVEALLVKGLDVRVVRLPQVHDPIKQGFVTPLAATAREKGVSAYVGDGANRWPAAHVDDVAVLYRLALEKGQAGARYHAVDEAGVALKDIAEAIGKGLGIAAVSLTPEEAQAHFGWFALFVSGDIPASSALTREWLGWQPKGPSLLADLAERRFAGT
jgi:nucleoside-diphosphate-sugar epimerase